MFEEEEFEPSFLAGLAEDFTGPEDFGDGAGDGNDLVPVDEGVEFDGEVGFGGEAASDAEGKTELVTGDW